MSSKAYFLLVTIGNIAGLVFGIVAGIFNDEINSSRMPWLVVFPVFLFAALSLLIVWVDVYKRYGSALVTLAVMCGAPVGALIYIATLYYSEEEDEEIEPHP